MGLGLTGGIAVKRTYEKPTFTKSSVRLQAVTASFKGTGPNPP